MKHLRLIAAFMLLLTSFNSFAQKEKVRVAVMDPHVAGTTLDEGTVITVREMVSTVIVNHGDYNIVERSLLDQVMKEQSFSNSGAVDENQATEIGRLTGASKVLVLVITQTGNMNMLSVKMIDVMTASVEKQKMKVVKPTLLLSSVEPIIYELLGVTQNEQTVIPEKVVKEPVVKEKVTVRREDVKVSDKSSLVIADLSKIKVGMKYKKLKKIYKPREYSFYKDQINKKYSPAVAGITSVLVPGLGQMVCGEVGRGLGNLLCVGGLFVVGNVLMAEAEYNENGYWNTDYEMFTPGLICLLSSGALYIWQIIGATKMAKVKNMYFNDLGHLSDVTMNLTPYVDYAYMGGPGMQPVTGMSLRVTF